MTLTCQILRKLVIGIGVLTVLPILPIMNGPSTGPAPATVSKASLQMTPAATVRQRM
jgi:hypothetical protein